MNSLAAGLSLDGITEPGALASDFVQLDVTRDSPPDFATLKQACLAGLNRVELTGDLSLMPRPDRHRASPVHWVRFLRDCTACAVSVSWVADNSFADVAPALSHLAPPRSSPGPAFNHWRDFHRFGLFYYRVGPGFITIVNRRDDTLATQILLDTQPYLDIFQKALAGARRDDLRALGAEAFDAMEAESILLSVDGWSVALPYRMRYFPVPFSAI